MARPGPAATEENAARAHAVRVVPAQRQGLLKTLGRKSWPLLHGLSDRWPCALCRPAFSEWMSGLHDAVNVRIGRRPFRPRAWERFRSGDLEGPVHLGCAFCRVARWAARLVAQVPRPRRA